MAFRFPTLTAATYAETVREACRWLVMPYRLREDERRRLPETHLRHVGAVTEDGLLVGYASALGGPNAGTWLRPGHCKVSVAVDPAWRDRGVGGALYRAVERFARECGATALESGVEEVDATSLAFAERRGFVKERHLFASTLDLTMFDASSFATAVAANEASGLRFTSFAAFGADDASLALLLGLLAELYGDEPGRAGFPAPTHDQLRAWYVDRPTWDPAGILLAVDTRRDDRWVAVAHVTLEGDGRAYNTFTGVRRAYRGRGLAQALKVKAAEYARAKGATSFRTHNDSLNAPMLAVNRKLGYRPESGSFTLLRRLDYGISTSRHAVGDHGYLG